MKPKIKKTLINLIIAFCSILLLFIVFFGTYKYFMNQSVSSYEKVIKKYTQDIDVINESTGSLIKGDTIDDKKVKAELEDKINKLLKIKESLDGLNTSEKYSSNQNNLSTGLNSNIYIYKQIVQIVNNPQASDGDKALEDLKKYRSECINYYSLVNIKNVKIALSSKALNFIDNTSYYLAEAIKARKKNEITQGQNLDFLNSIDEIITGLLSIKSDYTSYAIIGRNKSFNEALTSIDNNKSIYDDIKTKFTKITVPSSGIPLYKALSKTLNTEASYIQGFRYALDIERKQAIAAPLKPNEIEQLYSDANTLLNTLSSDYDDFMKLYVAFKS